MNARIGIILVIVGILVAAGVVLTVMGYQATPDPTPPDTVGEDKS